MRYRGLPNHSAIAASMDHKSLCEGNDRQSQTGAATADPPVHLSPENCLRPSLRQSSDWQSGTDISNHKPVAHKHDRDEGAGLSQTMAVRSAQQGCHTDREQCAHSCLLLEGCYQHHHHTQHSQKAARARQHFSANGVSASVNCAQCGATDNRHGDNRATLLCSEDHATLPHVEQPKCLARPHQPVGPQLQEPAIDRMQQTEQSNAKAADEHEVRKRPRWHSKYYRRDGIIDLWARAGLH